ERLARPPMHRRSGNNIPYLAHATFLMATQTVTTLLNDPGLNGNASFPRAFKKLPRVDVILVTHGHGDHIGDLLAVAREHKPKVIAIYETCGWLGSKGIENLMPMSKGGTQRLDGNIEVTMVHALHSNGIDDD